MTRLVALPTGVGEPRNLTRPGMDYVAHLPGFGQGIWFPDSRRVMFTAEEKGGPIRVYVQDIDGGDPRALGPPGIMGQLVSPDGRAFIAAGPDGSQSYPVDGGTPTPLRGLEKGDTPIQWSADGRSIFCRRDKGSGVEVFALEMATGRRTLLWTLAPADLAGTTGVDTVRVTPDGRSYAYGFFRTVAELYLADGLK